MYERFQTLRKDLCRRFPERQDAVSGALAAVLSGEHVLLLGPPGTAKSSLSRAIAQAFGGVYFERLLTKFSTPDELFGPVSLRALEEDRHERVVRGMLPEAHIAFLDEVFRANSSILNSLLTILNERLFHNDGKPTRVPLVSLFGASNDLPEGRELEAIFDRFLLRFDVQYVVQQASLRDVLLSPDPLAEPVMTLEDLLEAQNAAARVDVTTETVDALMGVRESLQAEGVIASDRRWKKCLKIVRASAWMAGESETDATDLMSIVDALWREPKERHKVSRVVREKVDPVGAKAAEILESARETARGLVKLRAGERSVYTGAASKAVDQYGEQKNALSELNRNARKRSKVLVEDALAEVQGLIAEATRAVAQSFGLSSGVMSAIVGKK